MAIKRLVSAKTVVAKVYRDTDIRDTSWETNAIEWVGDVLHLGNWWIEGYEATVELETESFKVVLPSDVKEIVDVWRLSGEKWVPMVFSREDEEAKFTDIPSEGVPWSYWLNNDVLVTTEEEVTLKVRYRRGCTDAEGYPYIFDSQNLQEACMWYIISRLFMRKFTHPVLNYQLAMEEYKRYFRQARSEIKFPSEGEMEELLRSWVGISYEETDYKLYSSAGQANNVYPGYGYVDYGTGDVTPAVEDPLTTGSGAIT